MSEEQTQTITNEVIKTDEVVTSQPATVAPVEKSSDISKTVLEAIAGIQNSFTSFDGKVTKKFDEIDAKLKALEKPTDLPLKPKGSEGGDDIGAKVKVPDTYQSNSIQAGIRDASPGNDSSNDKGGLKMQEKVAEPAVNEKTEIVKSAPENTFSTETPRGGYTAESLGNEILKSAREDYCPVLKMAREVGHERLSTDVAQAIKRGDFYTPSRAEIEEQLTW